MSKHEVPANELDDERTVWIRPDPDPKSDPGWRLRLDKQKGDLAFLVEEQVLPEKVDQPTAYRVIATKGRMLLTKDEATWLHQSLGEMLAKDEEW